MIKCSIIANFILKIHKIHVHRQATIFIEHSCQINQLDTALIIYVIFFFFFNTSRSDFVAFRLISYLQIKKKIYLFNVTPKLLKLIPAFLIIILRFIFRFHNFAIDISCCFAVLQKNLRTVYSVIKI